MDGSENTNEDQAVKGTSMDKEKILAFIEGIIDLLSFKRVALLALLAAIGLALYVVFENRSTIVTKIVKSENVVSEPALPQWELSDLSKQSMMDLTKNSAVVYIAIADVDLKKNRRSTKWRYVGDAVLKANIEGIVANVLPQAVFDYDAKNTAQMVAVLSNEFRCDHSKDTLYARFYRDVVTQVPTICRIAIPPFVGQFVGYIAVGISKQISKQELDAIRLELSRIAVEIYLTDVIKKPPTEE